MTETHTFGPVEFFVVEFEGSRPDPGVMDAVAELATTGIVRVLDLVIATRAADGALVITEVDSAVSAELEGIDLAFSGLVAEDDIVELLDGVPDGSGVAIAAFEMLWATTLASRLAAAGGRVRRTERIPAPLINELLAVSAAETKED